MSKMIKKLEVNGRDLSMTYVDNQWWVAIKPICEALGVNYDRQFQNIKLDEILKDVYAKQHMRDTLNRRQEMLCLPEEFIYGWIFSLNSESELLKKYKLVCYRALYNHFHGVLAQRGKILKEKTLKEIEATQLQKEIDVLDSAKKLKRLKAEITQDKNSLEELDSKYISNQLELWTA
jgi:prophage antirepressor-like protein